MSSNSASSPLPPPLAHLAKPAALSMSGRRICDKSLSSTASRPSLLSGLPNLSSIITGRDDNAGDGGENCINNHIPQYPSRIWKVSDTALPVLPAFYPPLDARSTAFISDPASVVAVRIAEVLRFRSVQAEYDEEACTALCLTADRCRFVIHLWQGRRAIASQRTGQAPSSSSKDLPLKPDFSNGVIVECVRQAGGVLTFHQTIRAVLGAASSLNSGKDTRQLHQTPPRSWQHLLPQYHHQIQHQQRKRPSENSQQQFISLQPPTKKSAVEPSQYLESLEHSLQLLRKDRLCAQVLGMESLLALTDSAVAGVETALSTALAILGAPCKIVQDTSCLAEIRKNWVLDILTHRRLPGDATEAVVASSENKNIKNSSTYANSTFGESIQEKAQQQQQQIDSVAACTIDHQHANNMRALSLAVFTNSLNVLAQHQPTELRNVLAAKSPNLVSRQLLMSLLEDLQGAERPVQVVVSSQSCLASQHEAALASTTLRLLCQYSQKARVILADQKDTCAILLDKARRIGRATHPILAESAEQAYQQLTLEERSC